MLGMQPKPLPQWRWSLITHGRRKQRPVVERYEKLIMVDDEHMPLHPAKRSQIIQTLDCHPLTMVVRSRAKAVSHFNGRLVASHSSERQGRLVDTDRVGPMDKKNREGFF
jgi:sulfate adenylyltransferase subunit 2